jgi:chemotaxis protein CheZ
MTPAKRKFRIEAVSRFEAAATPSPYVADRGDAQHRELMEELASLRKIIQPTQEFSEQAIAQIRKDHEEAMKIKYELESMYEAINRTKREIATLHVSGCNGHELSRVTDELDAVVDGTEQATETILEAAEIIDDRANSLTATLTGLNRGMAQDIQDNIILVFEACNFQDLTGQRITKVVNTLRFVEERILKMMEIWGGAEKFKDIEVELDHRMGDQGLLNGPSLVNDMDIASQDDIDALFS